MTCRIVSVGKRRDGGTRYWCLMHRADATARYGRRAARCRYAHIPPLTSRDILELDIDGYPGGVALWGAVPPIYDTTLLESKPGIHVHTRSRKGSKKALDGTYRSVRILGRSLPPDGVQVSELDGVYYMVSTVLGFRDKLQHIVCPDCGHSHLDKDWFSVHTHRRHLCAGCGRHFRDSRTAIGNPILVLHNLLGTNGHALEKADSPIELNQRDFPGGIQIWGSNPAFLWTGTQSEREGIHVHAYASDSKETINETFSEVTIDGIRLDPVMVRTLMAQLALPHIAPRVVSLKCKHCGRAHFSSGEMAFNSASTHNCTNCGLKFPTIGRLRKIVSNPMIETIDRLAATAVRQPQKHELGLLPETL